jgi:hypothetical protein
VLDPADASAAKANPGPRRRQQALALGADLQPILLHAPCRPRQHHDRRRELLQQRSTYLGYGQSMSPGIRRRRFSDRGLCRRHGARDDMASAQAWYPFGQGGSPHSPGGPLTALAADAPKESTAGPRCRSGWKLAGGLQSGARAAHPVPSRACPAQACPGFFLALGRSPGCTRCGRARTCCCRRHRAAPRDGCCSSQLAVPDRFKETGQRAFALVRRPTTAIVAAVRQGSIRPAWARATAPPSR